MLQIIYKKVDELIPYENNPRKNDKAVDYVAKSIEQFGFKNPIIIDKNNVIVCGHTRLLACKKLNISEVPCILADDLTDEQIKAFRLADNKVSEFAEWDTELLDSEIADIVNVDMSDFGFDMDFSDIDNIIDDDTKNDDFFYFDKKEIQEKISENWKKYESLDEFVDNIIDEPTAMYQFNRLCQGYRDGYNISLLFNKHRLTTEMVKSKDLFYGFNNDDKYKKSYARYIVDVENKVVPRNQYYKYIGIGTSGYQYVNEFPPYLARDIYKAYVKDGDKVLNPCAGWGGRLLGIASCMFNNIEYVETDPQTQTFQGLQQLKKFLHLGENYKQFNLPFEELELQDNYFDFVFTSPPYFDTEHYSDEATQSYKKNNSYENWKNNFLFVMIDKIIKAMKKDAICILNVGNKRYTISDDIKSYLKSKYNITTENLDYSLDNSSENAIRMSDEDFLMFKK